jgi:hypothetical protein
LYAQQRWLDPSTGRFLSLDPYPGELDVPMSTQGHTYLQGNPTSGVDPDGRCGPGGAAVGAVLGAAFGGIGAAYQNWGQSGHGFTKAVMKGIFLGGAGGAATGLTCGVGAALGIGTGVGAATSGITAMETAESWGEVGAAAGKGAAVGLVAGVAGAAVSGFAGAGASALTNSATAATKVVAQTAAEFGAGTVTSAAVQYATGGSVDGWQALIDGGAAAAGYGASRYGARTQRSGGGETDFFERGEMLSRPTRRTNKNQHENKRFAENSCGQTVCSNVIKDLTGVDISPDSVGYDVIARPGGTIGPLLEKGLRQHGVNAKHRQDASLADVSKATATDPVIAFLYKKASDGEGGYGHWAIVDQISKSRWQTRVHLRDPNGGKAYSVPLRAFRRNFDGEVIFVGQSAPTQGKR